MAKSKKKYTEEFKDSVVKKYLKDGIDSTITETGLAPSTIYGWAKKAKESNVAKVSKAPKKPEKSEHNKISQLEARIKLLEEENTFLKKLVDYFR